MSAVMTTGINDVPGNGDVIEHARAARVGACAVSLGVAIVKELIGNEIGKEGFSDESLPDMMAAAINSHIRGL